MLLNGAPAIDVQPVRSTGYCARLGGSSCPWVFRRRIEALPASVGRETLARRSFLEVDRLNGASAVNTTSV